MDKYVYNSVLWGDEPENEVDNSTFDKKRDYITKNMFIFQIVKIAQKMKKIVSDEKTSLDFKEK